MNVPRAIALFVMQKRDQQHGLTDPITSLLQYYRLTDPRVIPMTPFNLALNHSLTAT